VPLGEDCSKTGQCEDSPDVICGSDPSQCRKKCLSWYTRADDCDSEEYCRPEQKLDSSEDSHEWVGTCYPNECSTDRDCSGVGRICVPLDSSVSACLVRCSYNFDPGYADNCVSTSDVELYCQLVGSGSDQSIVCLHRSIYAPDQRPGEGVSCDPLRNHCERGFVCYDGACHRFCSTTPPVRGCQSTKVCATISDTRTPAIQICK
jgi:hypothetical protein